MRNLRILISSVYFDSDSTGIARYSEEMAEWLSKAGNKIDVIAAVPHYPDWNIRNGRTNSFGIEDRSGVRVFWVPVILPNNREISTKYRLVYEMSFMLASSVWWFRNFFTKYDLIILVHPLLLSTILGIIKGKLTKTPILVHVQDLQVDAAENLNLLKNKQIIYLLRKLERKILSVSDYVSTITEKMRSRIIEKTGKPERTFLFANWSDTDSIKPDNRSNNLRLNLEIPEDKIIVLYSGNMGDKQGLEIIIETAEDILEMPHIHFLMCGDGGIKSKLENTVLEKKLHNVTFLSMQPAEKLSELLAIGDIHLIIQKKAAADLVMPSKLTNIAAAGRPMIVTAESKTALYNVVEDNKIGIVVNPEDKQSLADAIIHLAFNEALRYKLGQNGRRFAVKNLNKNDIMSNFESKISEIARGVKL